MKKNIIFIIYGTLLLLFTVGIIFYVLSNRNKASTSVVKTILNPVAVDKAEQEYCDSLGPQTGSAAINTNFVSNLKENMVLKNNFELLGCIKNVNNSFGPWDKQDGYIATYEIRTSTDNLVSRGVMPIDEDIMELENLSRLNSHIPFSKFIQLGDTYGESTGYISIRNINAAGNPTMDKNIVLQIQFE